MKVFRVKDCCQSEGYEESYEYFREDAVVEIRTRCWGDDRKIDGTALILTTRECKDVPGHPSEWVKRIWPDAEIVELP